MTKYAIQSGGLKKYPEKAKIYFDELFKGLGPKVNVLWCYFASGEKDFEKQHVKYHDIFKLCLPKNIEIVESVATLDSFREQVAVADVIYFHGGDNETFVNHIQQFPIETMLEGKVVGTNSATTLIFAKHGWTCDERKCIDGLGIWPARVLVHYNSAYGANDPRGPINWKRAYDELDAYGDTSLPIYALEEGEFIVFEK